MSKLLQTQLPISVDGSIDGNLYNRLVRILEINLGQFDPDNTRQITTQEKLENKFNQGAIVFDTTLDKLQVYDGNKWLNIDTTDTSSFSGPPENGLSAQASLGIVSVLTKGATSIHL